MTIHDLNLLHFLFTLVSNDYNIYFWKAYSKKNFICKIWTPFLQFYFIFVGFIPFSLMQTGMKPRFEACVGERGKW